MSQGEATPYWFKVNLLYTKPSPQMTVSLQPYLCSTTFSDDPSA
ncbi:hypothetical protein HMPREF1051_2141 [Neisseria sicca VK64]|uniref:Uncharacterized protein n=1 Tax=Neisseria sicca VK64 TaxID=1095748 RepID=I2NG65_NEISI|nr:hypothetical protein HMPREF1051_2141 [Neisseria sicca VK64]